MFGRSEGKSLLYKLKPVTDRLPSVTRPEGHVHFRTKMLWVLFILIIYFVLTNTFIYGLDQTQVLDFFASLRAILAGAQGSLVHLGIGPIVTASIILQLFVGAKIIRLDLRNEEDKAVYQGTQKFLVLVMIVVESVPQVFGFLRPSAAFVTALDGFIAGYGGVLANTIIIAQLFVGSYVIFLMDEVVSKWGIGSGISLFIAAGVSQAIFTGTFNWMPSQAGSVVPAGTVPKTLYFLNTMSAQEILGGGYEVILLQEPNPLIALVATVVIFLLVAYFESTRMELPLAHGGARGARGRYPIKLIYASVLPVIFVAAILANISMFSLLFWQNPDWPLVGGQYWIGAYPEPNHPLVTQGVIQPTTPIGGIAFYTSTIAGLQDWLLPIIAPARFGAVFAAFDKSSFQIFIHVIVYVSIFLIGSIVFAIFWIETTGMGPEGVARQIESGGMQIPGFRRDPRVLQRILARYIPVVTIIGGFIVGALAVGGDLFGTVGNASGTGLLLAVGILIQFYEAIGREQMMEMHPILRNFFGGG
ncbi:MAG: preprotein translocase subunit SecY [Thermoplasmata archaeon]